MEITLIEEIDMATPAEKPAQSLEALQKLQDDSGFAVIRANKLVSIS